MKANQMIHIEQEILDQYDIEAIYVFGSVLKNGFLNEDIDLALLFKNKRNVEEYFNFTAMLHLYLLTKYDQEKKIDLSILNLASPLLKYEVITSGRVMYCKNIDNLAMFELRARQDYNDYIYRSKSYDEALIGRIGGR